MAFGKWDEVEGNIAPGFFSKDYVSISSEISSHFVPLISNMKSPKFFSLDFSLVKKCK